MSDSSVVGVLAEALAEHRGEFDIYRLMYVCRCGETWPALSDDYDAEIVLHSAHVASVVAALPNIAVVELPEPTDNGGGQCMIWRYEEIMLDWHAEVKHLTAYLSNPGVFDDITSEQAERIGLAFLAAARAAGGQA